MHLVMKLSKLCNLRCNYCYEYEELAEKERMSLADIEFLFKGVSEFVLSKGNRMTVHLIFHGGEPLLLPRKYLSQVCELRDRYFGANDIGHTTALQSNLTRANDGIMDLLQTLKVSIGASIDIYGDQRVDILGRLSQDQALENFENIRDRKIPIGAIAVLHALNIDKAVDIYRFYNERKVGVRLMPIFDHGSHAEVPERMRHLMMDFDQTLTALQAVAKAQISEPTEIAVYPLDGYFQAAVRYLTGNSMPTFNPDRHEWALIVNTNGDTFSHGDAYAPEGFMGNVFEQPLCDVLTSDSHASVTQRRMARTEVCRQCPFEHYCDQLEMAEAISSERDYDESGSLRCPIARPMIEFMVREIERSPETQQIIEFYRPQSIGAAQIVPV